MAALPIETTAFVIVLGDQPGITAEIIDALIEAFEKGTHGIIVPMHGGGTGHPIVISAKYSNAVMTQFDKAGLRGLVYGHAEDVLRNPVKTGCVLRDMDTLDDYNREVRLTLEGHSQ